MTDRSSPLIFIHLGREEPAASFDAPELIRLMAKRGWSVSSLSALDGGRVIMIAVTLGDLSVATRAPLTMSMDDIVAGAAEYCLHRLVKLND